MRYETLDLETDDGLGSRALVGLIVLRSDQTIEYEARQIFNALPGVALYQSRIYNDQQINRDTLLAMKPLIPDAARLLPVPWGFRSIGFACTSAAMLIGDAPIAELVHQVHPGIGVTNPVLACIEAFKSFGRRKIAVVTPYSRAVNEAIASGLEERGLSIPTFVSFEEPDDAIVARISEKAVAAAAKKAAADPETEGVFISCTSIRAVESIAKLERELGKPVTSSNHAILWHLLRLAGIEDSLPQFGSLYTRSTALPIAA
jgi:maleate isomerase